MGEVVLESLEGKAKSRSAEPGMSQTERVVHGLNSACR